MADRPATCAHCEKRLSRKQWYYRNGKWFCKKRCWEDAKTKAAEAKPPAEGKQPAAAAA